MGERVKRMLTVVVGLRSVQSMHTLLACKQLHVMARCSPLEGANAQPRHSFFLRKLTQSFSAKFLMHDGRLARRPLTTPTEQKVSFAQPTAS